MRGGRLIAVGVNKNRNATKWISPEHVETRCAIHAEVAALRAAGRSAGAVAYVARITPRGEPALSAPCPACAAALAAAGVRKVINT